MMNGDQRDRTRDSESWQTAGSTLADMTLDEVLGQGETPRDTAQPYGQIGIRSAPPGFRAICRDIAEQHGISFSQLIRLASKHGVAILHADARMAAMTDTYQQVRASALDQGHPPALTRLDQVHPFDFVRSQSCHTTLSAIFWVKGALGKVAD